MAEELQHSWHNLIAPSTPQLKAIVEWHRSVVSNDFGAYQKIVIDSTGALTGILSNEMLKEMFDGLRKTVPVRVTITAPFAMPSGNFLVHAFGCKGGYRHEVFMSVGFDGKQWRVLDGVWTPDINKSTCHE